MKEASVTIGLAHREGFLRESEDWGQHVFFPEVNLHVLSTGGAHYETTHSLHALFIGDCNPSRRSGNTSERLESFFTGPGF